MEGALQIVKAGSVQRLPEVREMIKDRKPVTKVIDALKGDDKEKPIENKDTIKCETCEAIYSFYHTPDGKHKIVRV